MDNETREEQEQRIKKLILDDLEETYHGEERRRRSQSQGPRLISTIDRWGPGVISILTFIAFIGYCWITDQRIARLEGVVDSRSQMEVAMRAEIQTWQAYVVVLQKRLIESGIKVPDCPAQIQPTQP